MPTSSDRSTSEKGRPLARQTASTAVVDGVSAFGQLGARLTVQTATRKAREVGLAGVAAFRCHHTGRIGEWAELGAGQGLVDYTIRNMVVLTTVFIVLGALLAMVTESGPPSLRVGPPTTR